MKLKRESKTEADQPPPKVIVRASSVPEPQAGTFQEYETKPKKTSPKTLKQSKHRQSPGCLQQTAETGIKLQVFSRDDPQHHPHDQPSVLLTAKDIQITQNQAFLPCPSGNEMQMELQTEDQELTVCTSQTKTKESSELPQWQSESSSSTVIQSVAESKSKTQAISVNPQHHHGLLAKAHSLPQPLEISRIHVKTPALAQIQLHTQGDTQGHTQHDISPHTLQQAQAWPKVLSPSIHQRQQGQSNATNPRPVHGQSEVFSRAHAMARSRMNKAKQHLQKHIEEVITIFSNRVISQEQARRKQVNLNMLHIQFIFTLTSFFLLSNETLLSFL